MKITVLGGSPKGSVSVTMQYVEFLKTNFPEHEFVIHQPAFEINLIVKNRKRFDAIIDDIRSSPLILWAFPLYVFTVCSQYQRFIELIEENGCVDIFNGKYAATLSTSIHFFDHTAHNYMRAVSEDFGMRFTGLFSAHMNDLQKLSQRKNLISFLENAVSQTSSGVPTSRAYFPMTWAPSTYTATTFSLTHDLKLKKAVLVTDGLEGTIGKMVNRLADAMQPRPEIIDISALDIKGGCMGCLKCGHLNVCAYTGKDAFIGMFREKVMKSDIIVFAGTMKGRHLSSRWKMFLDRSFFNTHQRVLPGKQIAFLISGPLAQNANLREILTAYAEWQNANLTDIVTDETTSDLDVRLDQLANNMAMNAEKGFIQPATFLGYGGMKVFRDDIYSDLRVVFQADHKAYRKAKLFDFPQNHPIQNFFIALLAGITGIRWVNKKLMANFKQIMVMPYRHLVKQKMRG